MPQPKTIHPDPVAPSVAQWAALTASERDAVVAALPFDVEDNYRTQGDAHAEVVTDADQMLENHFGSGGNGGRGRRIYVGKSLMVYYPGEPKFAPDVFVVFDPLPARSRDKWVVSAEGKGLDIVIEVLYHGDKDKDLRRNVERYADLGIPEYFVLDRMSFRIYGFRLPPGGSVYQRIVPQFGKYESQVLDLNIGVEGDRFRFYAGQAPIPTHKELQAALGAAVAFAQERAVAESERAVAEAERAEAEAERATAEANARHLAEALVRELQAQLAVATAAVRKGEGE